nr:hypothetical protein [Plesiomonas shigelloides]MBW3794431.1 hypothetical protein [Plesiomonas shigelloides]
MKTVTKNGWEVSSLLVAIQCSTLEKKQIVFGTSVWDSKELLLEAKAYLPQALRKRKLACGKISAGMGKMKRTIEPGHITLWLKKGSNIHLNFSEVK